MHGCHIEHLLTFQFIQVSKLLFAAFVFIFPYICNSRGLSHSHVFVFGIAAYLRYLIGFESFRIEPVGGPTVLAGDVNDTYLRWLDHRKAEKASIFCKVLAR